MRRCRIPDRYPAFLTERVRNAGCRGFRASLSKWLQPAILAGLIACLGAPCGLAQPAPGVAAQDQDNETVLFSLYVESSGAKGVKIGGSEPGTTSFTGRAPDGRVAHLTAPLTSDGRFFRQWSDKSGNLLSRTSLCSLVIRGDATLVAEYADRPASSEIWAWGMNLRAQLGNGAHANSAAARTRAPGGAALVKGGGEHSLALMNDGTVWGWGSNAAGQVGAKSQRDECATATQVSGLRAIIAIAAGGAHSLALDENGSVWAWGSNGTGQLGREDVADCSPTPVRVSGLPVIVDIRAGECHSLALDKDGRVWAWGANARGQLGIGSTNPEFKPALVKGVADVKQVAAGATHSLALRADGSVWAWGGNAWGQAGDGRAESYLFPSPVQGMTGIAVRQVAAGYWHSLALDDAGNVWAWGANGRGQLGDGTTLDRTRPVAVQGLSDVVQVAGGEMHSLALRSDGTVCAWGRNSNGELCSPSPSDRSSPATIPALSGVRWISAGAAHSLAVVEAGGPRAAPGPQAAAAPTPAIAPPAPAVATDSTPLPLAEGPERRLEIGGPAAADADSAPGRDAWIVDNRDRTASRQFKLTPRNWQQFSGGAGTYGRDYWSSPVVLSDGSVARARFTCTAAPAGVYRVFARWPARTDGAQQAGYEVHHADGTTTTLVNQSARGGQWNALGTYRFAAGSHVIELFPGLSTGGAILADAVCFAPVETTVRATTTTTTVAPPPTPEAKPALPAPPAAAMKPMLVVLSPREAGQVVQAEVAFQVQWAAIGLPGDAMVSISLYRKGTLVTELVAATRNDGSWLWPVSADLAGEGYRIRIQGLAEASEVVAESESEFQIVAKRAPK